MARQRAAVDEDDGQPGGVGRLLRLVGLKPLDSQETSAGVSVGTSVGDPVGNSVGGSVGTQVGNPVGDPVGPADNRVAYHRVGDTFERVSERGLTPLNRAGEFLQFLESRGLSNGWLPEFELEGIYYRFEHELGLPRMSWAAVRRGLGKLTRKRKKEFNDVDGRSTETQYWIPPPKRKTPPA
jgi:hypothetical protein